MDDALEKSCLIRGTTINPGFVVSSVFALRSIFLSGCHSSYRLAIARNTQATFAMANRQCRRTDPSHRRFGFSSDHVDRTDRRAPRVILSRPAAIRSDQCGYPDPGALDSFTLDRLVDQSAHPTASPRVDLQTVCFSSPDSSANLAVFRNVCYR